MTKERVIRLATNDFLSSFETLFPEVRVFNPEKDSNLGIDLLIFSGGEDVGLDRYMDNAGVEKYGDLVNSNPKRDAVEAKIFDLCMEGTITVNKILGVCRGMQFINVMLGGTLYPDLPSVNKGHRAYHKIIHQRTHPLNYLTHVNSLHHQAICNFGNYYSNTEQEFRYDVIAYEENTQVYEIVSWNRDEILGVQFHPEFFVNGTEPKDKFIHYINKFIFRFSIIYKKFRMKLNP